MFVSLFLYFFLMYMACVEREGHVNVDDPLPVNKDIRAKKPDDASTLTMVTISRKGVEMENSFK